MPSEPPPVPEPALELRTELRLAILAGLVKADLGVAGIPIAPGVSVQFVDVGASVEVDLLDGDVQITWLCHHALREVGLQDYARLKRDSAAMRFSSEVDEAMLDAMQRILT